jgi:hypothetical protein
MLLEALRRGFDEMWCCSGGTPNARSSATITHLKHLDSTVAPFLASASPRLLTGPANTTTTADLFRVIIRNTGNCHGSGVLVRFEHRNGIAPWE